MTMLAEPMGLLRQATPVQVRGTVAEIRGMSVHVADLPVPVGADIRIVSRRPSAKPVRGEVVGFDQDQTVAMLYGNTSGIAAGDRVIAGQYAQAVRVGRSLLGRVLNGLGEPIDGKGPVADTVVRPMVPETLDPLNRPLIDQPLGTGVRAIDTMLSVGRGQRLGVFASPGLGKSTLLGTMAKHTAADVSVVALVGERGREVRDFIDKTLGADGLSRSVVVCATGDESPLLRVRAALVATAVAEHFRDDGLDVLLIMDSVTRFCQAQRQIGLAAGEPPTTKGYPPSVFANLPTLLERSGRTHRGSITGFYAVLAEGDELTDPVTDAAKGILDGHVHLSSELANKGHWPAIDVLRSVSRVAGDVQTNDHRAACNEVRQLLHNYNQVEDLLNIGAYSAGSNPDFDLAIAAKPVLDQLLQQGRSEGGPLGDFQRTSKQLMAVMKQIQQAKQQLQAQRQRQQGNAAQGPR